MLVLSRSSFEWRWSFSIVHFSFHHKASVNCSILTLSQRQLVLLLQEQRELSLRLLFPVYVASIDKKGKPPENAWVSYGRAPITFEKMKCENRERSLGNEL